MSFAAAEALQRAVFQRLKSDPTVTAKVEGAIYDAADRVPDTDLPTLHIALGAERVRDGGSKTSHGAVHDFSVVVHGATEGFAKVKAAAGAVCDALIDAPLSLTRGKLVGLSFVFAQASRGRAPERRRIELRFRAWIDGI